MKSDKVISEVAHNAAVFSEHVPVIPGALARAIGSAFDAHGALQRMDEHFHARAHQKEFALLVGQAIENRGQLVVEAGTGTGKTYAYLVPVLASGRKALLSTATKGLQDQLFWRDLPHVSRALGLHAHVALLKGRSNYLCLQRLELAQREPQLLGAGAVQRDLARVVLWAQGTRTGDLAEMSGLGERSAVLPWVTSNRENCLGNDCPRFRDCHLMHARREAMAADVVVVNHHLFFADLSVRESGVAELLPTVDVVVFDEAHQLNEAGLQFLGIMWSSAQAQDFARDMLAAGQAYARGMQDWIALRDAVEQAVREFKLAFAHAPMNARLAWDAAVPQQVNEALWRAGMDKVTAALTTAGDALEQVQESSPELARLRLRAQTLGSRLMGFAEPKAMQTVRWVEAGASLRLMESPLDIAQTMRERCLQGAQAWVFTSATLGADARLSWFTRQVGIDAEAVVRKFESPFDYAHQAALYVPPKFVDPGSEGHAQTVAQLAAELIGVLGGRTFVLTTTLRALRAVGDLLSQKLEAQGHNVSVLVQGARPKRELLQRFRESAGSSVLVGSQSFWEGIDVAGDDLQLVIIDKLPFPPPGDPLVQARRARIESEGGNAFNELFVPEAAVALKQGAGRLIRRESDRGVLVIADVRLRTKGYGKRLLAALPPMRRLQTQAEAVAAVLQLQQSHTAA